MMKPADQELKRLNQMRRNIASMVAHELRTPLTSIQGYATFLRDGDAGPITEEQQEILDIIVRNSRRLSTLIDNFLDLEKIESGMFSMDQRYFHLENMLEEVEGMCRIAAQNKGLRLELRCEQGLLVNGDKNQIYRVFSNLVSNAIKFTETGTIRVQASKDAAAAQITVTVQDQGTGIPPEDLPHIFERFYQGQYTQSGPVEGSGLGLAISKAIVIEHDGTIRVEAPPGQGTTFTVVLPQAPERRALPRVG